MLRRRFKVNERIDRVKITWLKEHTVTVIFRERARFLPKKVKDDIVRAYEDDKIQDGSLEAENFRRGRVKVESPNVVLCVAKSRAIAAWMVTKGHDDITIGLDTYKMKFKPWMSKAQPREQRREEDELTFWVIAVQVPLDSLFYLEAQVAKAIGPIIRTHPTEPDLSHESERFLGVQIAFIELHGSPRWDFTAKDYAKDGILRQAHLSIYGRAMVVNGALFALLCSYKSRGRDTPFIGGQREFYRQCSGKRIFWRQKLRDHTLVVFDDDTVEKWPLEVEGVANSSESGKGEVTVAVVSKGGQPPPMKKKKPRWFSEHPGIAAGKPWEKMGMSQETCKDDVLPVLDGRGLRIDERTPEECRPAFLKTGTISQGTGSAYAEFGNTKVLVGVYGPRETNRTSVDVGRLVCDVKVAAFATPVRGKYGQTKDDREYGVMLHRSLIGAVDVHSFPGLTVDVFALILQSGGADIAVVTTCASMALAHARVPMHDLVAATCVSYVDKELLLDPSTEEERQEDGALYLAAMSGKNEVTHFTMKGEWLQERTAEAVGMCMDGCIKLSELVDSLLKEQTDI
ncbi:hypothetical protein CBR_g4182 [Chara braunii]|uniref:Uncharacterized protein n=1 Tax=Chara braunii TaxID=69332 RepID=A0A388KHH0_CHABU|nr:hypothetical protein CBR_g4182 [Chara braunii]|eukprot:GBG69489.1 hypothetical protein CBR_g4182 [Chara braunii]